MSSVVRTLVASPLLFALACSSPEPDPGDEHPFPPPAEGEGFQLSMTTTAPAGTEIWKCNIYDLPTTQWENVGRVESIQNPGMHHMDIMALTYAGVELEPGEYDCDELYQTYPELMEDGLMIYASQMESQTIDLPPGTAANLPPGIQVMHEIHHVNTSDADVEVFSYVNAYSIHPNDVTETIWGGAVRDTHINIPAQSAHSEWTRCVMTDDIDLLFLSSHTHQLGKKVTVRMFDGETVGEEIYVNEDWHAPRLIAFDTPLHIPAGTGFEFQCDFDNPTDDPVGWGFTADDEMCQIALDFTPGEARRTCDPVASSDGVF
jgi:hypothetical protein